MQQDLISWDCLLESGGSNGVLEDQGVLEGIWVEREARW